MSVIKRSVLGFAVVTDAKKSDLVAEIVSLEETLQKAMEANRRVMSAYKNYQLTERDINQKTLYGCLSQVYAAHAAQQETTLLTVQALKRKVLQALCGDSEHSSRK